MDVNCFQPIIARVVYWYTLLLRTECVIEDFKSLAIFQSTIYEKPSTDLISWKLLWRKFTGWRFLRYWEGEKFALVLDCCVHFRPLPIRGNFSNFKPLRFSDCFATTLRMIQLWRKCATQLEIANFGWDRSEKGVILYSGFCASHGSNCDALYSCKTNMQSVSLVFSL